MSNQSSRDYIERLTKWLRSSFDAGFAEQVEIHLRAGTLAKLRTDSVSRKGWKTRRRKPGEGDYYIDPVWDTRRAKRSLHRLLRNARCGKLLFIDTTESNGEPLVAISLAGLYRLTFEANQRDVRRLETAQI